MADLITAALTRIGYAQNELDSGDTDAASQQLAKARTFLVREQHNIAVAEDAAAVAADETQWSGTFDAALARFLDALEAKQRADGVEVMIRGSFSGHAYTRAENIDLATSIGVLDELGGDDFFGALVPGASQ